MRLSKAIKDFLDSKSLSLTGSSLGHYDDDLRLFYNWAIASVPDSVLSFTAELIEGYLLSLSKRGMSMATLARRRAVIGELSRWGHERRIFYDNAIARVKKIKRPKSVPRAFDIAERDRLMALPLEGRELVVRTILHYAGLRVSEVCELRVRDFASEARTLRVTRGKGAKERVVPVPPECVAIVRDWVLQHTDLHPMSYIFGRGVGQHLRVPDVQYMCEKWGRAADVVKCHPHRWRHSYATMLLERGADVRTISILMGHENIATTAQYLRVTDQKLRDAVNLLSPTVRQDDVVEKP